MIRRLHRRGERGFTLIELMLTLLLMGIVMNIIVSIVYFESRGFMKEMDFSETQQNARASIALLRRYTRLAGWGMVNGPGATGVVPFGACYDSTDPKQQTLDCDEVDSNNKGVPGTDRLRVVYMLQGDNDGTVHQQPYQALPGTNIPAGIEIDPVTTLGVAQPPGQPLSGMPGLGLISGPCIGATGSYGADLLNLSASAGDNGTYWDNYPYTNFADGTTNLACAAGYDNGFSFGKAVVADFYIDRTTDTDHPTLRVRLDPTAALNTGYVVAYDIDDLQVRYFIDAVCTGADCGAPDDPDFVWDMVCDSFNGTDSLAACEAGVGPISTKRELLARTMGATVAIVARSRDYDKDEDKGTTTDIAVQNDIIKGRGDGYRRWVYRTSVLLRNNEP